MIITVILLLFPTWTCRSHQAPRMFRRSHKDCRSTRRSCVDTGRHGNQVCTGSCTAWSRPGDRCPRVGMASWSTRYTWLGSVGRRCLSTHCKQIIINWTDSWSTMSWCHTELSDQRDLTSLASCGPRWTYSRQDKVSVLLRQRQVWFIPFADERGVCR